MELFDRQFKAGLGLGEDGMSSIDTEDAKSDRLFRGDRFSNFASLDNGAKFTELPTLWHSWLLSDDQSQFSVLDSAEYRERDPITGETFATVEQAWQQTETLLETFVSSPDFTAKMQVAFGKGIDVVKATELLTDWTSGKFAEFPSLDIRSGEEINGASGAFSEEKNKIYLSKEFLAENSVNIEAVAGILLEEIGHAVDSQVNEADAPGDEGEIFSALVRGKILESQQLQDLKTEDDTATVTLDGDAIQIEQGTVSGEGSVSDSGGFEGSNGTIQLKSNGGGKAKYSFEFFEIPDNLILRYEGKELLNTGFVSGSQTGEVQIPKGSSKELEVIVATNNEGTAWNYNVTNDNCPDTTPLVIELASGQFEDTDGDGDCDGQGTIYIGRKDGISRMLKVEGRVEYTEKTITVDGIVSSVIGAGLVTTVPLFQGKFDIDVSSGTTSSFQETGKLSNEYKLGGLEVDFSQLTLNRDGIALGANFKLLEELGLPEFFFSGSDALLIKNSDVDFGSSVKFSLPNFKNFNLFNFVPIKEFSDFSIEYVAPEDKIKIQGKLVIDDFTKTEKLGEITADLAGENFIEIQGGKTDIKGSLSVETDLKLIQGWGLTELKLNIDTKKKDIGGSTKIEFPFKSVVPPGNAEATTEVGFKLPIPPLELNKVSLDVDNLNVPIPNFPLVLFQGFNGGLENLAKSDSEPIEFSGGIKATLGPQIDVPILGRSALIRGELNVKVSSEQFTGSGKSVILNEKIAQEEGSFTLNWKEKFYETKGNFSILDGLIQTSSGFKVDSGFNINMSGSASFGIPKFIPLFGGAQIASGNYLFDFSNDGNLSNDFAAAWGTLDIQKFGFNASVVVGFKGYFNGEFERIGSKNIPPTNSFIVEPGTEWVILGADWENDSLNAVPVTVKTPDGTIFTEADFNAANQISIVDELTDANSKVVVVFNPTPGVWDIEVADTTGLGLVEYTAATDSEAPTIDITTPATDVSGGNVTIGYNAFDPDSNAEVKLFYDTDNQGLDGILIADGLAETDGAGSFVWNTEGVAPGDYYIYAMAMDENNAPVFSYSPGRVQISEQADLSVTKTASADTVGIGDNLTYKVTVTNNGTVESKGVTLTDTLPEGVTLVSSTLPPTTQVDSDLTFDLGNLAAGQSAAFDITVTPTTSGSITNTASITSRTFDPDVSNDVDFLTTTVVDAIPPEPVDLSVVRTDSPDPTMLGENFTYTLAVTNNSPTPATGVILTENLLSGMNVVSATSSQGTVSTANNAVRVDLGTLNGGETANIPITANSIAAGNLVSTTDVASDAADLNPTNNSLIQRKTVNPSIPTSADLELSKTVSNPTPNIGEFVNLNLTLTNTGPGIASSIRVTDLLPPGLSFVGTQAEQGTYDPITGIWDVGNIRDNLSRTLTITAKVEASGPLVTTAEVTAVSESDPDSTPGNNNPNEDDLVMLTLNSTGDPNRDTELSSDFLRFLKIYGLA